MIKQDIYSNDRALKATAHGAYAIDTTTQQAEQADFTVMQDVIVQWNLANISSFPLSSENTLVTDVLIEDGDKLILIKDGDIIVPFTASGVIGSGPYTMDVTAATEGEIPLHVYKDNVELLYNDLEAERGSTVYSIGSGTNIFNNSEFTYDISGFEQDGSSNMNVFYENGYIRMTYTSDINHYFPPIPVEKGKEYYFYLSAGGYSSSNYGHRTYIRQSDGTTIIYKNNGAVSATAVATGDYVTVRSFYDRSYLATLGLPLSVGMNRGEYIYVDNGEAMAGGLSGWFNFAKEAI